MFCVVCNVVLLKADVTMWLFLCSSSVSGLDFASVVPNLAVRIELYITTVLCTTDHSSLNIYTSLFSTAEFSHPRRAINRADRHCLCQSLTQKDQHIHFLITKYRKKSVISGSGREVDVNCVLLGDDGECSVQNCLFRSEFITVMLCTPCRSSYTPWHAAF